MFICEEKEQILLCSATVMESMKSLSPVGSNLDSSNGIPPTLVSSDLPPLPSVYTDVNIVPEHKKTELHQSILNLEGEVFLTELLRLLLVYSFYKWLD